MDMVGQERRTASERAQQKEGAVIETEASTLKQFGVLREADTKLGFPTQGFCDRKRLRECGGPLGEAVHRSPEVTHNQKFVLSIPHRSPWQPPPCSLLL